MRIRRTYVACSLACLLAFGITACERKVEPPPDGPWTMFKERTGWDAPTSSEIDEMTCSLAEEEAGECAYHEEQEEDLENWIGLGL